MEEIQTCKKITQVARIIITLLMVSVFAVVWVMCCNTLVFRSHQILDGSIVVLLWLMLYLKFGQMFEAFQVAAFAAKKIFSRQLLTLFATDLFLYGGECVVRGKFPSLIPYGIGLSAQAPINFIWTIKVKQYFFHQVESKKCLLLYAHSIFDPKEKSRQMLLLNGKRRKNLQFDIVESFPATTADDIVFAEIEKYPVIFLYQLPPEKCSRILRCCKKQKKHAYVVLTEEDALAPMDVDGRRQNTVSPFCVMLSKIYQAFKIAIFAIGEKVSS